MYFREYPNFVKNDEITKKTRRTTNQRQPPKEKTSSPIAEAAIVPLVVSNPKDSERMPRMAITTTAVIIVKVSTMRNLYGVIASSLNLF